jgi:uncharacterized protein
LEQIFVDTHYWIAVIDSADPWHLAARAAKERAMPAILVTTDEILVEALNAFSGRGVFLRDVATRFVFRLRREPGVLILEQSRAAFDTGLILYDSRRDKGYSLVDCISMNAMRRLEIGRVLTNDRHFAQEGFRVLMP